MKRSRRWFLSAVPFACVFARADRSKPVPAAFFHYNDASTEIPVLRLTDPAYTSRLPAHFAKASPKRGNFLLYGSDVTGRMEAFRMESKSGVSHQLTEEDGLDPASITLTPDERSLCCVAGGRLLMVNLGSGKVREVYRVPPGFETGGMGLAEDGLYAALIEKKPQSNRLRLIKMADGTAVTLAEASDEMGDPIPRPRRAGVLYGRGNGIWLANYDAQQNYRLKIASGDAGTYNWTPNGVSVLYLNYPMDPHKLHDIREFTPDTNEDVAISDTTQFVAFERNGDASVFVGASGAARRRRTCCCWSDR